MRIDAKQDWKLLYAAEKNGYTIFKFERKIKLCDADDRIIEAGSPNVIFAWGLTDPQQGQDISYHYKRGTKKLVLISGSQAKDEPIKDVEYLDFSINNVILPRADTFYYCEIFQVPKWLTKKRHIIKVK